MAVSTTWGALKGELQQGWTSSEQEKTSSSVCIMRVLCVLRLGGWVHVLERDSAQESTGCPELSLVRGRETGDNFRLRYKHEWDVLFI